MDLSQFVNDEHSLVESFKIFWMKANARDPSRFPLDLTTTLWQEQLDMFKTCYPDCDVCTPINCKFLRYGMTEYPQEATEWLDGFGSTIGQKWSFSIGVYYDVGSNTSLCYFSPRSPNRAPGNSSQPRRSWVRLSTRVTTRTSLSSSPNRRRQARAFGSSWPSWARGHRYV